MISEKELLEMKNRLSADVVDDAEELLMWFASHGAELIDEILLSCRHIADNCQSLEDTKK